MKRTRLAPPVLLLAGLAPALVAQADTTAVLKGSTLVVTGSADPDDLLITSTPPSDGVESDTVVVTSNGGTVNGLDEPALFEGVLKLKILLGDGADTLAMTDFTFDGSLVLVRGGSGNDHVSLTHAAVGAFKFFGETGDDTLETLDSTLGVTKVVGSAGALTMTATSTDFDATLAVTGGPGIDHLTMTDSVVNFFLTVKLLSESDLVALEDLIVGNDFSLKLSSGNDQFVDVGGFYGNFVNVAAGAGNDTLEFRDATIGNTINVKLGGGVNQLSFRAVDDDVTIGNDAIVKGGSDIDTVELVDGANPGTFIVFGNNLILSLKAGANELQASGDVDTGDDLRYSGGGTDDVVVLEETDIGADASISLAGGTNNVVLHDCSVDLDLRITAGAGDDTVDLAGTDVAGLQLISLGGGINQGP